MRIRGDPSGAQILQISPCILRIFQVSGEGLVFLLCIFGGEMSGGETDSLGQGRFRDDRWNLRRIRTDTKSPC